MRTAGRTFQQLTQSEGDTEVERARLIMGEVAKTPLENDEVNRTELAPDILKLRDQIRQHRETGTWT